MALEYALIIQLSISHVNFSQLFKTKTDPSEAKRSRIIFFKYGKYQESPRDLIVSSVCVLIVGSRRIPIMNILSIPAVESHILHICMHAQIQHDNCL